MVGGAEQLVEREVESAHEAVGYAGREAEETIEQRGRRVALVVDRRGLFDRLWREGDGAREGAVDGASHVSRFFHVDANGAFGAQRGEVAVEQVPQGER